MLTKPNEIPSPLPWYVHLLVGHALGGFFSWILVARQFYLRGKKFPGLLLLCLNTIILLVYGYASVSVKIPWHQLLLWMYVSNLVWALGAWLCQRTLFGPAPRRYRIAEWRNWVSPLLTALFIAVGLAVVIAVFPVIAERFKMLYADDVLDKKVILWDFFVYIPFFIPYGLLIGGWWAGKGRRFSAADVITYLSGLVLFYVILIVIVQLFLFLFYKGHPYDSFVDWQLIPPQYLTALQNGMLNVQNYDQLALVIVPLLLGSVSRIRDFLGRALVIFPVVSICVLPLGFYSAEFWMLAQGQIMHNMTSPDKKTNDKALKWAETLLVRFPEHDRWPEFAMNLAWHRYDDGDAAQALDIYSQVAERYADSPRWQFKVDLAREFLGAPDFGNETDGVDISLPLVNYESYLTPNWMALLQVIRYWSDADIPESEILIRLKSLSTDDEKIKLNPLPGLAELDDAAESLGYRLLILPSNIDTVSSLLEKGVPVVVPVYNSFYLFYGIDRSRSILKSYSYKRISRRLMDGDREEIKEILSLEKEGKGASVIKLRQIAEQAYTELPISFWGSAFELDSSPFVAVIYPDEEAGRIEEALPGSMPEIQQAGRGYLASLIALKALDAADPVQSIEWARISSGLVTDPLPLHVAHLAQRFWQTRDKMVLSRLGLEERFPHLAEVDEYFDSSATRAFLEKARKQFEADLAAGSVSWMIRNELSNFLDRSNPAELEQLIFLARHNIEVNPVYRDGWLHLAELYEWQDDVEHLVSALEGALEAESWNNEIALLLAYRYVQLDRKDDARRIMTLIDSSEVSQNAHYIFCRGVLADWEGDPGKAEKHYAKAIELRRYVPLYHLRYGELLLRDGRIEDARKALQWAVQVDVERGRVGREARSLLQDTLTLGKNQAGNTTAGLSGQNNHEKAVSGHGE